MPTTKKKPSAVLILLGAVLSAFIGYLAGGAWPDSENAAEFLESFLIVADNPFHNYFNEYTLNAVVIALVVYAIAIIMYYTSQRNYMPGKEYGTAKYANVEQVNKALKDEDESFNRILSQNVRMSLNTRKTKLNNNVLVIGGSGAGKTFYEVKPNLMQMPRNCSFICTDPKGEILRSCGGMLKRNGYNVKVINLLEMEKSDCYNPFSYIREETDIVKLITNLISNTTPKGSTPSDPFWEKAESLFLQALFYYVWMEEKPAKRNFETVLKLMGEGGLCTGITQNVVDLLQNYTATTMLANSEFVALLKQANTDSAKMAEVIGVSEAQLRFVTNSSSGMGLIKCGPAVIPFDNQISKDTDLYKLYNTNIHELIAERKAKANLGD